MAYKYNLIEFKSRNSLLFVISLIIVSCTGCTTLFPQITNEEASEVKNICDNLTPPPSFVKVGDDWDNKHIGSAVVSRNYRSSDNKKDVENYFEKQLASKGWQYQRTSDSGTIYLRFKKNKYSVVIEYLDFSFTLDKNYGVSCSIGVS